jgi:radical SAM superfamily enzyme YgiQ (UPF0313 family)
MRAGHQVKVLNLSAFSWPRVEEVIGSLDADLWAMSCWTANRRGVALVAREIERRHPDARIVVGGPHAAPLAADVLRHHAEIDAVCVGESEHTFLEIAERLREGRSLEGVRGAVWRGPLGIVREPERGGVPDLDVLASPHDHFDTHIVMTSRGCPWACTFCGAESQWGRGFRAHSVEYTLDALEGLLARLPVKMVMVKDDTFTTQKKRVIELCRGIRARGLKFLWSCDTRVDLLSEELLYEMRLAGCERLSLGVESGSQRILDLVDKKITVDEILESTALAKAHGIKVRYYMMLGNRGETAESFRETLAFLDRARPHEYIFSCLSIYPGTHDFVDAKKAGWLDPEVYFEGSFQELKAPFDASDEDTAVMNAWFQGHCGLQRLHRDTVDECRAMLARLGDHHAAHVDLCGALVGAGEIDDAAHHARRALDLGYPVPGLAWNYLAVIAARRGDYDGMMEAFSTAAKIDPQHYVLIRNVEKARRWFKESGPARGVPLDLEAHHDFQVLERTAQPTLPGPLPADWKEWREPAAPAAAEPHLARVGSQATLRSRRQLKVV